MKEMNITVETEKDTGLPVHELIPECGNLAGIFHEVNLQGSKPSEAQKQAYGQLIRAMRDLPYECIIFSFLDAEKEDGDQTGLVFYQVAREKDGRMDAEVRIDTRDGRKMYRILTEEDHAVEILDRVLETGELPEWISWEDITGIVFPAENPADEKDQFELLTDIRRNPDQYYPLVDHAEWCHKSVTESGDVNIGWNVGLLEGNRPWFGECWARDGMTMLTYFISSADMEDRTPEQLKQMLEDAGIVRFSDPDHEMLPTVSRFTDGKGNPFFSVNLLAGLEDETYLTKDSGIIYSFRELNRFNKTYQADR